MQTSEALRVAVDIVQAPSRVPYVRSQALPPGIADVLHIAAGDQDTIGRAVAETGRTRERIVEAAAFFIEQAMFLPDADSYRILGGTQQTPTSELRRNMALLMRWLHPDANSGTERGVFATRISQAWDDVKTDERRALYDSGLAAQRQADAGSPGRRRNGSRRGNRAAPGSRSREWAGLPRPGMLRWLLHYLFASRTRGPRS